MKSWDTNFLVRHIVVDDVTQSAIVLRELEKNAPIWLFNVTLVETFWVLTDVFNVPKKEVFDFFDALLMDPRFRFEPTFPQALHNAKKRGDLPEHIIAQTARAAGALPTQTFDKALKVFPEFEVR